MVEQYVKKDHKSWDKNLPALQFAYNTAVYDATGYTPAFLNHGRELALPSSLERTIRQTDEPDLVKNKLAKAGQNKSGTSFPKTAETLRSTPTTMETNPWGIAVQTRALAVK